MLVVVAPNDRRMRIEVGYGLEGTLTDAAAARIIRDRMTPRFKANDYDGGVAQGVAAIVGTLEGSAASSGASADTAASETKQGFLSFLDSADVSEFEKDLPPWPMRILLGAFIFGIIGLFTFIGIMTPGMGWFLYLFLIPFWAMFPIIIVGVKGALLCLVTYVVGFPLAKLLLRGTDWYAKAAKEMKSTGRTTHGRHGDHERRVELGRLVERRKLRRRILRRRRLLGRRRGVGQLVKRSARSAGAHAECTLARRRIAQAARSSRRRSRPLRAAPRICASSYQVSTSVSSSRLMLPDGVTFLVAERDVELTRVRVDERFAAQRDAIAVGQLDCAHLDERRGGRMKRRVGNRKVQQQQSRRHEMRVNPLERRLRRRRIGEQLERPGSDERCAVAERNVQLRQVLPEQRRRQLRGRESRFARSEHRRGRVDPVHVESTLQQRDQQTSRPAHRFQHRPRVPRQPRFVPRELRVLRARLVRVVELACRAGRRRASSDRGRDGAVQCDPYPRFVRSARRSRHARSSAAVAGGRRRAAPSRPREEHAHSVWLCSDDVQYEAESAHELRQKSFR